MPSTVNGIGTHYYGKQNVDTRVGVCEHCGKTVELLTYETRLWFVIVFIPIIPLGRKQIIDYCPSCTWHRAAAKADWDRMKTEAIGDGMTQVSKDPNDPKAAMELLGSLAAFRKKDEARQLAAMMETRFAGNFDVQFLLGSYHEQAGDPAKADASFERALALNPEDHAARRAVGMGCIQRGDLVRARQLLSFMESPGPDQDAAVLRLLAAAYQGAGQRDEALEMSRLALQAAPALGRNRSFRKDVRRLEKTLGQRESMLPANRRIVYVLGAVAAVAVLILGALFAFNSHRAGHQTLHVLNGLANPLSVSIDGGPAVEIQGYDRKTLSIGEGTHEALARWQPESQDKITFQIQNGFWERMRSGNVFALNPGGAGVLVWQEFSYAVTEGDAVTPTTELRFGEKFIALRNIDYPFTDPPKAIRIEGRAKQVRKTHVTAVLGDPAGVIDQFPNSTAIGTYVDFCEIHLGLGSGGAELLNIYSSIVFNQRLFERGARFLERGLARRPVDVEWHRIFQELSDRYRGGADLAARYDAMLAKDPDNSALLYLRGRIESGARANAYFDRAIAADPKNSYPWYARGHRLAGRGAFAEAKKALSEAARLAPANPAFREACDDMRFALAEYAELRKDLEPAPGALPPLDRHRLRLAVLMALGDVKAAEQADRDFAALVRKEAPDEPNPILARASAVSLQFLKGDWDGLLRRVADAKDIGAAAIRFQVYIEQGQADAAERSMAESDPAHLAQDAGNCLLTSLLWTRQGREQQADKWRQKAITLFAAGDRDDREAARLLEKPDPLDFERVLELSMTAAQKRVFVVALAAACPSKRTELLSLAEKLNYAPWPPHRFLKAAIDDLRKK